MIIDCVSDLHGYYPKLEGGDLLIVAGDLTARDKQEEHLYFLNWIAQQNYKKKIWIAGNHDNFLIDTKLITKKDLGLEYLCDSETEFEGLKIYGSPWTKTFPGMNPHCKAFTVDTEEELKEKWELIPDDVDILITHSPPEGILDKNIKGEKCGSKSLRRQMGRIHPKLWAMGHIHEAYSELKDTTLAGKYFHFVNCCYVNERYHPVNKPIRVVL